MFAYLITLVIILVISLTFILSFIYYMQQSERLIKKHIASAPVALFVKSGCPYCERAEKLLSNMGANFKSIDIRNNKDVCDKLKSMTKHNTVPNIFVNGNHIGGYDDIESLEYDGTLKMELGI